MNTTYQALQPLVSELRSFYWVDSTLHYVGLKIYDPGSNTYNREQLRYENFQTKRAGDFAQELLTPQTFLHVHAVELSCPINVCGGKAQTSYRIHQRHGQTCPHHMKLQKHG